MMVVDIVVEPFIVTRLAAAYLPVLTACYRCYSTYFRLV